MGVIYYEMWQFAAMCSIRILKTIFVINLNFKDYTVALHTAQNWKPTGKNYTRNRHISNLPVLSILGKPLNK